MMPVARTVLLREFIAPTLLKLSVFDLVKSTEDYRYQNVALYHYDQLLQAEPVLFVVCMLKRLLQFDLGGTYSLRLLGKCRG